MRMLIACVLGVALPLSAQAPSWPVAARPVIVIGVDQTDPNLQLAGVFGARRLPDGRLVVADSASHEVRVYDTKGKFVTRIGRRGLGPGEFRGHLNLYATPGDSLLFYDDATQRWTLFTPGATLVRSWLATTGDRERFAPIEYRRTLIHATGDPLPSCYQRTIGTLATPHDTAYREAFPDGNDRVWLRDEGMSEWRVYALAGGLIARVALPARFELLQIGDGFVVGTRRDAEGVDRVEVLAVAMAKHEPAPACAARTAALPKDTSSIAAILRKDARQLQAAGEAFRMDYGHYPMTFDSLTHASGITHAPETQLALGAHNGTGYDAVARTARSPRFCRILVGDRAPSWLYGVAFCGPH